MRFKEENPRGPMMMQQDTLVRTYKEMYIYIRMRRFDDFFILFFTCAYGDYPYEKERGGKEGKQVEV